MRSAFFPEAARKFIFFLLFFFFIIISWLTFFLTWIYTFSSWQHSKKKKKMKKTRVTFDVNTQTHRNNILSIRLSVHWMDMLNEATCKNWIFILVEHRKHWSILRLFVCLFNETIFSIFFCLVLAQKKFVLFRYFSGLLCS